MLMIIFKGKSMFHFLKKYYKSNLSAEPIQEISQTKRLFFKGMATAGVAFAAVGSWKNGWVNSEKKSDKNLQAAYDQDVLPGDEILQNNGFEEISKQETEEMIQMFIDDYEHKRQV
jgi:hypothetical protein